MECGVEKIWHEWKTVRLIGEGSFGKVYEVVRNRFGLEERSAVKVIAIPSSFSEVQSLHNDGMTEDNIITYYKGIVSDFVQEIAMLSKLRGHANIVGYEDYEVVERTDRFGWDIYIRMELLNPLPTRMDVKTKGSVEQTVAINGDRAENAVPVSEIVRMAVDICSALELCYERHIIHRDIKPDNIFVSDDGVYKLGDFGVARTIEKTMGGLSKKGTPIYMAPEIYKGERGGMNSDLCSLGVMMYKLLNYNREPFLPPYPQEITYDDKQQALHRRINGEPLSPPCFGDAALHRIVLKACETDPSRRYQTPMDMKKDLLALGQCGNQAVVAADAGNVEVSSPPSLHTMAQSGDVSASPSIHSAVTPLPSITQAGESTDARVERICLVHEERELKTATDFTHEKRLLVQKREELFEPKKDDTNKEFSTAIAIIGAAIAFGVTVLIAIAIAVANM